MQMVLMLVLVLCGAVLSPVLVLLLLLWLAHIEETLPGAVDAARRQPAPPPILAVPVRRPEPATVTAVPHQRAAPVTALTSASPAVGA